jgi:arylsulfatase A-like enzyme
LGNNGSRTEAIREGPWKLVVSHPRAKPGSFENEHVELYNLQEDASETKDLSTANPDQTLRLLTRLKSWYADTQRTATLQPGGW